ncbi:hypothetical protein HMPREF1870_00827 [Bacteroidales bacterium KA00344]|nr:hypothetical protein HMPREF1870_00827 [Bacteroidales bacterium KA00344]
MLFYRSFQSKKGYVSASIINSHNVKIFGFESFLCHNGMTRP